MSRWILHSALPDVTPRVSLAVTLTGMGNYDTGIVRPEVPRLQPKCRLYWSILTARYIRVPVLRHLHWLAIRQHIEYKPLLQVYRALSGQGPSYISDLVQQYIPARSLRSAAKLQLVVPRTHSTFGNRAFSSAGSRLWNSFPISVRWSTSLQIFNGVWKLMFLAMVLETVF